MKNMHRAKPRKHVKEKKRKRHVEVMRYNERKKAVVLFSGLFFVCFFLVLFSPEHCCSANWKDLRCEASGDPDLRRPSPLASMALWDPSPSLRNVIIPPGKKDPPKHTPITGITLIILSARKSGPVCEPLCEKIKDVRRALQQPLERAALKGERRAGRKECYSWDLRV